MANRKSVKNKPKRKLNKKNLAALIIGFLLVLVLIGSIVGVSILAHSISSSPELKLSDFIPEQSSQILDKDDNSIGDIGTQIRTNVNYDNLPTSLIDAFVAVEDSRYFNHNGFDLSRFLKALLVNIRTLSFSQGGSTFTMQLVKNTYFVDETSSGGFVTSIERKIQEIPLAIKLEKTTDKKTILSLYLNKINFGGSGNMRGVQKAAQYYFNKDVSELNLAESALLAGIINAPNRYNPFNNLDLATSRRNTVLYQMYNHGYITKTEYELAKSIKVEDLLVDPSSRKVTSNSGGSISNPYQAYIDTVVNEVIELTGLDPTTTPMIIHTCMDSQVQNFMDNAQAGNIVEWPDDLMEFGMVSMNNQTGEVLAIAAGRNYSGGGSMLLNHATDQYKQPGSSIKTLLSYALAFENLGWSTSHVVTDRPIVYAGTDKVIKNADGNYYGQITLTDAIGRSLNTPAISTLQELINTLGASAIVDYLQSLGFSQVTDENFDVQFAIGGSNLNVSVMEMAGAHSMILNGGQYIKPHTVKYIEFLDGRDNYYPDYSSTQVLSSGAAYMTALMEYQAVNGPYQNYMQICKKGYQTFGKTGTTDWGSDGLQYNIPQGAVKDRWMAMSTTQFTNMIWVGYEKGIKDEGTYFDSSKSSLNLTGNLQSKLLDLLSSIYGTPSDITRPDDVSDITHILATFPYASTIENMDPALITSGVIKTDSYNLVDPQSQTLEDIQSFDVDINNDLSYTLHFATYPNQDQLTVADSTMDLSLDTGSVYVEAYGPRLFDYSWIFGAVKYKAVVKSGDNVIAEIYTDQADYSGTLEDLDSGNYSICGMYTFENLGTESNQICQAFTITKTVDTQPTSTPEATAAPTPSATTTSEATATPSQDSENQSNNTDDD